MTDINAIKPDSSVEDIKTIIEHFKAKRDIRLREFIDLIKTPDHISYSHYSNYLTEISVLLVFLISKTDEISISIPLPQFAASDLSAAYEQLLQKYMVSQKEIKLHLDLFSNIFRAENLDHFNQNFLYNIWTKYVYRQMDIENDEMKLAEYLGIC